LDESITLGGVKPFHDAFFSHYFVSPSFWCRAPGQRNPAKPCKEDAIPATIPRSSSPVKRTVLVQNWTIISQPLRDVATGKYVCFHTIGAK
jgi:hypothetical protein